MNGYAQWRIDRVHRLIHVDMTAPRKADLWALQNPNISAVTSRNETSVRENLALAGKKVELNF